MRFGRCRHVCVEGETALTIHVDGEFFSLPADGVCDVEVTMLAGALQVQV